MKNGEIVYVVCMSNCTPDGGWPCAVFSSRMKALKECRELAEKAKECRDSSYEGTRKAGWEIFRVERISGGFGVRMMEKGAAGTGPAYYPRMYYVERHVVDKGAKKIWWE